MAVVLLGTLDTKGRELGYVRDLIRDAGLDTILVDAGTLGPPAIAPDIPREELLRAAGHGPGVDAFPGDRGAAVALAAEGAAGRIAGLDGEGRLDGLLAIGGSAGTVIGTAAMRGLPFGRPKVMVSTLASGQVRPYVGGSDILMFHPVADLAGLNRLTRTVLANAAHAMIGMVRGRAATIDAPGGPVVAATMFGVTTPCVDRARAAMEATGVEVIVFHATGIGGQSMEGLIRDGLVDGVLDLTTTELADEIVGGLLTAGPDRLRAAGRAGIPQVVSLGALDMVNFGPRSTVPPRFEGRRFHVHNETVTLMRTTPGENAAIGRHLAAVLREANGPVAVMIPRGGVSALDVPGMPFHDPEADAALFGSVTEGLRGAEGVEVIEVGLPINAPAFADLAASTLLRLMNHPRTEGRTHDR